MLETEYSYLATSPLQFEEEIERLLEPTGRDLTLQFGPRRLRHIQLDPFVKLAPEIIFQILTYLFLVDIRRAALASPWVALWAIPTRLPQSFWHSRFQDGFELGFASSRSHDPHSDWRKLYFAITNVLRDPTRCPSLSNRKRIWKILDENEALFYLVLSGLQLAPAGWGTS
jgi:hypothetical protein